MSPITVVPELSIRTLDITEVAVAQTGITSTTNIDITDLNVSFLAPPGLPYIVKLKLPAILLSSATAPAVFVGVITDMSDVEQGNPGFALLSTNGLSAGFPPLEVYFPPSTGTKTYKARCRVSSGDTFSIQAATSKISLHAYAA